MPTYDYECKRCKHQFEQLQQITAAPLTRCPKCRCQSLRRLIGAGAGIIFKGSGFFATDYRSKSSGDSTPGPSKSKESKTDAETGSDADKQ